MQKESIDNISNYPMLFAAHQQLYDYAVRLHFDSSLSSNPYSLYNFHQRYDPRFCEEPKPSYSYIGLIAMAILSTPERRLVLADIYQWILDRYPYFRARGPGWRNSIRHNLSLNDCFIKTGRSANGKGHYWSIHPANLADFISGDFRRRRAQRRVRKSMGLIVPEEEEEDDDGDDDEILPINETERHFQNSLSKIPVEDFNSNITNLSISSQKKARIIQPNLLENYFNDIQPIAISNNCEQHLSSIQSINLKQNPIKENQRKRCFNVDSLLAPDEPCLIKRKKFYLYRNDDIHNSYLKSDSSTVTETYA
ncbi:unnamed protein product [Rotaria sp. Silwood1]|nr:unnamed protein product [Rotaria sp. Silwood1]CAF1540239.1 unnamed protein product [Rotaria sp. Silwood1]CAF3645621.1 unnamed protein product [Rotaria sp. Silwood1]CAF3684694.1 unnamed protein product [Rotaria sp. Silwood1]CAF5016226.1 unnamed protein product [Rotaria sp. Silwood1]